MSRRKPAPKPVPMVSFKFSGGESGTLTVGEIEQQLMRSHARAAQSDDPQVRELGLRYLAQAADRAAAGRLAPIMARAAAAHERPGRKHPMRQRILDIMGAHKRSGGELKVLIERWQREAVEGIGATLISDKFYFTDENGDAGQKSYKLGTLTKMFSES